MTAVRRTGGLAVGIVASALLTARPPDRLTAQVPAAVHDVAVDSRYLWVATDGGLVRFARSAALGR
jgi:hypothetical protein